MRYISTRGGMDPISFKETVLMGLAPDAGLIVPEDVPNVRAEFQDWADLSYPELAFRIIRLFSDIPEEDLHGLVLKSYTRFDHSEIAPIREISGTYVLELFHGPTLSFKDIALQFLGNVFSYVLAEKGSRLNILAATSGDTGSAAIEGVRGRSNINIFVMHPQGGISALQERQMTTVLDSNVYNIAIDGSFDDCQAIMKRIFSDNGYKQKLSLGSVNSVNWARILAQIVYYFYSYFRVREKTGCSEIQFAVPTGNFGDILAGYYARMMSLPIRKLILATNENDILARFFNSGAYRRGKVVATVSPAMDIQVASNFERYLYYRLDQDAGRVVEMMDRFAGDGEMVLETDSNGRVDKNIVATQVDRADTKKMIETVYREDRYVLDPHTAVGVAAARALADDDIPVVAVATAHAAKFPDIIREAIGIEVRHDTLCALKDKDCRQDQLPAQEKAVRKYIEEKLEEQAPQ